MEKLVTSDFKLGIIAGGQLAKMLILEASKWDIKTYIMDDEENCPAKNIATHFAKGSRLKYEDVYNFGKSVDLLTFEIENINTPALYKLKSEGLKIAPDPAILELIRDKGEQKNFYQRNQIPTASYQLCANAQEVKEKISLNQISYPFVQKIRIGGYDGRGVTIIKDKNNLSKLIDTPSVIEKLVKVSKEISVIAARNRNGEVKCYPPVEMFFDTEANLVDKLICPSSITPQQTLKAEKLAAEIAEKLNIEGILAVEFFIDDEGEIIVNEIAPRPHNSGHHTIESIITSQYEQHLRAVFNLPLGSTKIKSPSIMINLLGETGSEGSVTYEGLTESIKIDGVKVHVYGKTLTKPMRKMGHVTILADSVEKALEKSLKIKKYISVKSK